MTDADILPPAARPGTIWFVGMGQKPPRYLRPGDMAELGIDGLGRQRQTVQAYT